VRWSRRGSFAPVIQAGCPKSAALSALAHRVGNPCSQLKPRSRGLLFPIPPISHRRAPPRPHHARGATKRQQSARALRRENDRPKLRRVTSAYLARTRNRSLDHLVGAGEQRRRNFQAEHHCCFAGLSAATAAMISARDRFAKSPSMAERQAELACPLSECSRRAFHRSCNFFDLGFASRVCSQFSNVLL